MPDFPIRVGFCAPSRAPVDVSTPALAKLYFTDRGAQVEIHDAVFKNVKQFAGVESERIDSIMSMACNPEIDLVMPIRGGSVYLAFWTISTLKRSLNTIRFSVVFRISRPLIWPTMPRPEKSVITARAQRISLINRSM